MSNKRLIIGLGHRAQVGKDTIADYLRKSHGFHRTAFANTLKGAAGWIFGFDIEQLDASKKEQVDPFWGITPREAMQKLGVALRQEIREDIWIKSLERTIRDYPHVDIVVTDVRFPNEAEFIRSQGGFLWKVLRPQPVEEIQKRNHISETALNDYTGWDVTIHNHGTLEDLYKNVDYLIEATQIIQKRRE